MLLVRTQIANFGYIYKKNPMKVLLAASCFFLTSICFSQSWQWGKRGGSTDQLSTTAANSQEEVRTIVTDSNKNIYILSSVGMLNLNIDGHEKTNFGDPISLTDVALASFACDGSYRWSKIIGSSGKDEVQNLGIDDNDNIYIAGKFGGCQNASYPLRIDDDIMIPQTPEQDCSLLFLAKYNSGGVLQWFRRPQASTVSADDGYSTVTRGLSTDHFGNSYWLVKISQGVYAEGAFNNTSSGSNWFVLKYDSSGSFLTATSLDLQLGGSSGLFLKFYRNPNNGNYFITSSKASNDNVVIGGQQIIGAVFMASFDSSGQFLWKRENTYQDSGSLFLYNLVFDNDNNIYTAGRIAGFSLDSFIGFSVPESIVTSFIMKMNGTADTVIWSTYYNRNGALQRGGVVLNGDELGYAGYCYGTDFTWGNQTIFASNINQGNEALLGRFNRNNGDCIELVKIPGDDGYNDVGISIAADASGDYIVGGGFGHQLEINTNTLLNSGSQSDFFLAKYATSACSPLGIAENTMNGVQITPNPASQELNLNTDEELQYMIFDFQGKLLLKGKVQQRQIDVTQLARALYVLKLQNNTAVKTLKFLKD
jgi:hypothetical protein